MSGKKLPTFFATFDFTTIFVNSRPLQKRDSHHIFPTLAPRYPLSSFLPFVLLLFFFCSFGCVCYVTKNKIETNCKQIHKNKKDLKPQLNPSIHAQKQSLELSIITCDIGMISKTRGRNANFVTSLIWLFRKYPNRRGQLNICLPLITLRRL